MAPHADVSVSASHQSIEMESADPGSKFGVALMTVTFVFIAIILLGDMLASVFR